MTAAIFKQSNTLHAYIFECCVLAFHPNVMFIKLQMCSEVRWFFSSLYASSSTYFSSSSASGLYFADEKKQSSSSFLQFFIQIHQMTSMRVCGCMCDINRSFHFHFLHKVKITLRFVHSMAVARAIGFWPLFFQGGWSNCECAYAMLK